MSLAFNITKETVQYSGTCNECSTRDIGETETERNHHYETATVNQVEIVSNRGLRFVVLRFCDKHFAEFVQSCSDVVKHNYMGPAKVVEKDE